MKYRIEVNGEPTSVDLLAQPASIEEVKPGVFSVLMLDASYQVNVASIADGYEAWVGLNRYVIKIADARDKAAKSQKNSAAGPVEVRAQMPGKIIKLLVDAGSEVLAGQGLIVVEAMKMQNEVKSSKNGTVAGIYVAEGSTVGAGELLLVVE